MTDTAITLLNQGHEGTQAVGAATATYTVGQLITYFAADLPASSNYPRHARAYLEYCLREGFGVDAFSAARYTDGFPPNRITPVRRLLKFCLALGSPRIVADLKKQTIPPAANDLVLRFIRQAKTLRGDHSKVTYQKALNAFFLYLDKQTQTTQTDAAPATLSGLSVSDFVQHLKDNQYSAFTVNLYLSAIKQLAGWCIRSRDELHLNEVQLNALRDIADVRGLAIERTFYKDSLDTDEREQVLDTIDSARDKAIISLLALEGLRTVEVTRLRLGDLDVARQQLLVLGKGKNTKKAIKLFARCSQTLQAYLTEQDRWPIPAGCHEFLFPDLKTHQIRYIVDKQLNKHGLKRAGMSAHSLRHTVGQLLLEQGVTLEHVQQHLRHETMETTQFYTKKQTRKTYFQQMPD
jgi:integrase/recombinase XerC